MFVSAFLISTLVLVCLCCKEIYKEQKFISHSLDARRSKYKVLADPIVLWQLHHAEKRGRQGVCVLMWLKAKKVKRAKACVCGSQLVDHDTFIGSHIKYLACQIFTM